MTHTKRIYNNPRLKKAQRYNLDDPEMISPHGFVMKYQVGIPLTRRSWICMGHCPRCRDRNKEPNLLRKRKKEQFRFELKNEFGITDKSKAKSYEEITEFWDTHDLTDYWDETKEVKFEVDFMEISWKEWAKKSRLGEVCGVIGCTEKPEIKCDHCGNHYCKTHSVIIKYHYV